MAYEKKHELRAIIKCDVALLFFLPVGFSCAARLEIVLLVLAYFLSSLLEKYNTRRDSYLPVLELEFRNCF